MSARGLREQQNLPGSTPALSSSAASNVSSSTRACWALPEGWAIDAVAGLAVAILEGKRGKVGLMLGEWGWATCCHLCQVT